MDHLPSYVADWGLGEAERGVESFTAFLRGAGAQFTPPPDLFKLLEATKGMKEGPRHSPRELFEEQLMRAADKQLASAGDARRLFREVGEVRRWRLLTPEQAKASGLPLQAAGAPFRRAMWGLATVPVALGTYLVTEQVLRAQGLDENYAWLAALAVWALLRLTLNRTLLARR